MDGKELGVHLFLVPLRDLTTHEPLPGELRVFCHRLSAVVHQFTDPFIALDLKAMWAPLDPVWAAKLITETCFVVMLVKHYRTPFCDVMLMTLIGLLLSLAHSRG